MACEPLVKGTILRMLATDQKSHHAHTFTRSRNFILGTNKSTKKDRRAARTPTLTLTLTLDLFQQPQSRCLILQLTQLKPDRKRQEPRATMVPRVRTLTLILILQPETTATFGSIHTIFTLVLFRSLRL
jgi:hypothetical protein